MSDAASAMEKEIRHEKNCRENLNKWSIEEPLYKKGTVEYDAQLVKIFYAASDLQYSYTMSFKILTNLITRYPDLFDFKFEPGYKTYPDNIFDCIYEIYRKDKWMDITKGIIRENLKNLQIIAESWNRLDYYANECNEKGLTNTERNELCKQIYKDVKFLADDCNLFLNVENVEKICKKFPELYYETEKTYGLLQCLIENNRIDTNYIYQTSLEEAQERLNKKLGSCKKYIKAKDKTNQSNRLEKTEKNSNKDRIKP